MKLFDNKKGEEETSFTDELVKVLLVVGIVVILLLFASNIWAAVKPMSKDDFTKQQFDKLAADVQSLIDGKKAFSTSTSVYSFSKEYFVAGFDYNMVQQLNTVQALNPIYTTKYPNIYKPELCFDESNKEKRERACLCLYKGDVDALGHMKENKLRCYKFDEKVVFLSKLPAADDNSVNPGQLERGLEKSTQPFKGQETYEYLFLYSKADNTISDLYIEKYIKDGIIYVYITLNHDEFKNMFNAYHNCPDNSDSVCIGKLFGQTLSSEEVITVDPANAGKNDISFICGYDETQGKCVLKSVGNCPQEIFEPCMCERQIRYKGWCIDDGYAQDPLLCDNLEKCEDYCILGSDKSVYCATIAEIKFCKADPCKKSCKYEPISGTLSGHCVSS